MKNKAFIIPFIFFVSFLTTNAQAETQAFTNCTDTSVNPYVVLCSDKSVYVRGEPIYFRLSQSRIPIFIGPLEHPWRIFDARGRIIYEPQSTAPTEQPAPAFNFYDSWNQKDFRGKQVKKGTYYIKFNANVSPLPFEVKNNIK